MAVEECRQNALAFDIDLLRVGAWPMTEMVEPSITTQSRSPSSWWGTPVSTFALRKIVLIPAGRC